MAIADGSFFKKKALINAINHAKKNNSSLHLMGLVGSGGVHSNIEHLFALIQLASRYKFEDVYLHLFTDGRDSPPTSAKTYIRAIDNVIKSIRKTGIQLDKKNFDLNFDIDNIDWSILKILRDGQGHKPISTYEIRKIFYEQLKIEISQSTIHNRIKKLEEKGVILNYTINFNPKEIGYKGKYLLRIKPKDPSKYNELALRLDMNKNITDLFRIGEEYGLFAIIRVKNIENYATFIKELYSSEEIEDTYTNFVLDELKPFNNFLVF